MDFKEKFGLVDKSSLMKFAEIIDPYTRHGLTDTKEVARIFECSDSRARKMQDNGTLSLCKLPFSNRRRFLKSEVYELAIEDFLKYSLPKKPLVMDESLLQKWIERWEAQQGTEMAAPLEEYLAACFNKHIEHYLQRQSQVRTESGTV